MVEQLHALQPIDRFIADISQEGTPEDVRHIATLIPLLTEQYQDQTTETGQPLIDYVCAVAQQLHTIRLDSNTLKAVLLSFLPYQTDQHKRQIRDTYGLSVDQLLDDIHRVRQAETVMKKTAGQATHYDHEMMRKLLMSLAKDIRVVVVTIAMHAEHLRFLAAQPRTTIHTHLATLGLTWYAPLANRLGIWQLKWPIEDLSFRFLHQEQYLHIARQLQSRRTEREAFIDTIIRVVQAEMAKEGICCQVYGRAKHIYSIYNKMRAKKIDFDQLYDLLAIRILVTDIKSCYTTLGIIHNLWTPIPKEFDDYIHQPKANLYQSLHTAVMANGRPVEVQIRTHEMHQQAEMGVSAHWRYKEGDTAGKFSQYNQKIALLRQLLMWQKDIQNIQPTAPPEEEIIYVFTPQYDVIDLKNGCTPLDFAYRIHTNLAHRCRGARVNGQIVSLNTPLRMMDQVDIIAAKTGGPSRDWLDPEKGFLHSARSRAKVRHYFVQEAREETFSAGKHILQKELQRLGQTQANHDEIAKQLQLENAKTLYIALYHQEVKSRDLAQVFHKTAATPPAPTAYQPPSLTRSPSTTQVPVSVMGITGMLTQLSGCCHPAPGDEIIGFITKERGITIHRQQCPQMKRLQEAHPERCMPAEWQQHADSQATFEQVYTLHLHEAAQEVIPHLVALLSQEKIAISQMQANHHSAEDIIELKVTIRYQYKHNFIHLLQKLKGVTHVNRR